MKTVVIYSGGMDSYTALNYFVKERQDTVHALSFNYGQKHSKELAFAQLVCVKDLKIPHKLVNLKSIKDLLQGSALTSPTMQVPTGHYEDISMKQTVVPNRNMIMLSLAIGYAVSIMADSVAFAAHAGDHAIYPDCRPQFVAGMNQVAAIANYHPVSIQAPYLTLSKADIVRVGLSMGLDYSKTWSCYIGGETSCGKCGTCVERREAFELNHVEDPLPYEVPLSESLALLEKKKTK